MLHTRFFQKSSKRGALCQYERSRVTHNTQQTLNTYTDKHTHIVQRQGERYYRNRKEIRLYVEIQWAASNTIIYIYCLICC
jgi:hypothetical protein